MTRWWERERSLLAAHIRSTRRRLRASFRGALREAVKKAAWMANEKARAAELEAVRARDDAAAAASRLLAIGITQSSTGWSRRLVVEVVLDNAILMRANPRAVLDDIGRHVARAVEVEWGRTNFSEMESGYIRRPRTDEFPRHLAHGGRP